MNPEEALKNPPSLHLHEFAVAYAVGLLANHWPEADSVEVYSLAAILANVAAVSVASGMDDRPTKLRILTQPILAKHAVRLSRQEKSMYDLVVPSVYDDLVSAMAMLKAGSDIHRLYSAWQPLRKSNPDLAHSDYLAHQAKEITTMIEQNRIDPASGWNAAQDAQIDFAIRKFMDRISTET